MKTFAEKFKDPRWIEREEQVIRAAGGECQDCDAYEDLSVHINYFPKGVEPWELPDRALRVCCPDHRRTRRTAQTEIREHLSGYSTNGLEALVDGLEKASSLSEAEKSVFAERVHAAAKASHREAAEARERIRDSAFLDSMGYD
ncbi:MAG: hypothetical protein AAF604_08105 [Acidobacteriota bacterium]